MSHRSKSRGKANQESNENTKHQDGPSTDSDSDGMNAKIDKMTEKQELLLTQFGQMNLTLTDLKHSVGSIETRLSTMEQSMNDRAAFEVNIQTKTDKIESDLDTLTKALSETRKALDVLQSKFNNLYEQTQSIDCHGRRNNLILHGIPESDGEIDLNCYQKVVSILKQELGITNADSIRISRCHRLGRPARNRTGFTRPRPIIFHLHWYGDRSLIWDKKDMLRNTQFFLTENFSPEVEQRRRKLLPIFKAAKAKNMKPKPKLVLDKLTIAGKTYTTSNLDQIPDDLNPEKIATPSQNNITAFYSSASPLSNFYPTQVSDEDGTQYFSSEQYYQHRKALFHNDDIQATAIMKCSTSHAAYQEGKKVKGQDNSDWFKTDLAKKQMLKCCLRKFFSDEHLKEFLLNTGETDLVEASPFDKYWGVGIKLSDPAIFDKAQWSGSKNYMGEILTNVREQLK